MKKNNLSPLERMQANFFPYAAVLLIILVATQINQRSSTSLVRKKNQSTDSTTERSKRVMKPQSIVLEAHTDSILVAETSHELKELVDVNCELVWLAVDSLPFVSDGEAFVQVPAGEYFQTPAVLIQACPYNDGYAVSVIEQDSFYYPKRWLTDAFWSTSHWTDALKHNEMSDGDEFLSEALGLEALVLDSLTKHDQLWKFKMDILSTLSIADSMKNATGAEMKEVMQLFTFKQENELLPN